MSRTKCFTLISVCGLSACGPQGPCDGALFPDVPVVRIAATDSAGRSLLGKGAIEYPDGTIYAAVPLKDLQLLDRSELKGRAEMTVLVTSDGYSSSRVRLAEWCELAPALVTVVLATQNF